MFRPPVNRAISVLDRSFFKRKIPISAARILDQRQISKCRTELQYDLLKFDRMQAVRSIRDPQGQEGKALLLKPVVKADGKNSLGKICFLKLRLTISSDTSTWSPRLSELVKASQVVVVPYDLEIDYGYWTYRMYVQHMMMMPAALLIPPR